MFRRALLLMMNLEQVPLESMGRICLTLSHLQLLASREEEKDETLVKKLKWSTVGLDLFLS